MKRRAKPGPEIPAAGEGKRGAEGHLGYLLRQAHAAVRGAMEKALADLDVTPPQFAVLTMVVNYPGISGAELARLTFLTPQTINVIVRNLVRAELVSKSPDPAHGRILRLHATPPGVALLKRCRARVMDVEGHLQALLARDEEQVVRRWLVAVGNKLSGEG